MEILTCNIQGKAQHRELLGRKFLVVGGTLINPGVLNGSQGPLLYPEDEVKKRPSDWNHVPITLYHPPAGASARTPEVVEAQGLGFIFSTNFSRKLQSEFWFDADRVDAFDKRHRFDPPLRDRLEQGLPIDCSTGLDLDRRPVENGDWKGVRYTHTTANYRPDHVAVLPDMKGACSVADGCGVNNDQPTTVLNEGGLQMALTPEQKRNIVGGLVANCGCADAPWSGKTAAQLEAMTDNELSLMDQLRQARAQNAAPTVVETYRDPAGNVHEKLSNGQWRSQIAQAPVAQPAQNQGAQTTPAPTANGARTQSEQEWLKAAPPTLAKHLERLQGYEANRRKTLVDGLTANADPALKPALEAAYGGMDLDALEAVALAQAQNQQAPAEPAQNGGGLSFLGQGGAFAPAAADEPPPALAEVTTNADYWAKKAG